jgi:hypothetical protein
MVATYNTLVTSNRYEELFGQLLGENKTLKKVGWRRDCELTCFIFQGGSTLLSEIDQSNWKSTGLRSFMLSIDMYGQATLSGNLELAEYAGVVIEHTSGFSVPADALSTINDSPAAAIIKTLDEIADEAEVIEGGPDEAFGKRYESSVSIRNTREIPLAAKLYELESAFQDLALDYAIACPGSFFDGEYEEAHYEIGPFAYARIYTGPHSFVYISESEVGVEEEEPTLAPGSAEHKGLVGPALIAKVDELGEISKIQLALACGYDDLAEFFQAVLQAKSSQSDSDASSLADLSRSQFDFNKFSLADEELINCSEVSSDIAGLIA